MNRVDLARLAGNPALVAILLFAFALRLHGLATRSLWFDEAIEYWMGTAPLDEVLVTLSHATHDPPLYTTLLHFWQRIGMSEFWLRSMSPYFSLMGIAGVARLAKSAAGMAAGLVAGLLLAVSAADVRYAQEAGQYALMVFTVAWYLVFLRLALLNDGWPYWALWGGAAVVAIYSHYGAAIVVVATSAITLLYSIIRRQWPAVRRQVSSGVVALLLLLPLVFLVIPNQLNRLGSTGESIDWLAFLKISEGIIRFQLMGRPLHGWPWPGIPVWVVSSPMILALIVALVKFRSVVSGPTLLICVWITYYLIGRTGTYFFVPARHSLLLTPLLITAAAMGIAVIWQQKRALGLSVLLVIVVICLVTPREGQEDIRAVSQYWRSQRQPGEATYVYYGAVPGFRYQLDVAAGRPSENVPATWYLECFDDAPAPYCLEDDIFYGRWLRDLPPELRRESILETIGSAPERLWLVFSHVDGREMEDTLNALATDYEVVDRYERENGFVYLLERHSETRVR